VGQAWDKLGTGPKVLGLTVHQNSQMSPFVELVDSTLLIRFDQPEIRNPLSVDVVDSLLKTLDKFDAQSTTTVVFTGTGSVFASGADLREIAQLDTDSARGFAERGQMLMNKIDTLNLPTIAAINGYCFGGGLDLALACKVRIASPDALFCHPGVSLGIITGWGGTQRLPRLVGEAQAIEMLLTAKQVSAEEALRIRLIDKIADDVLATAMHTSADEM
jgi:enoyl-CoA hydratase